MEYTMKSTTLAEIADRYALQLRGPDREITSMGALNSKSAHRDRLLTYATSPHWVGAFANSGIAAAVIGAECVDQVPEDASVLVAESAPGSVFYEIFADSVDEGRWPGLGSEVGADTTVAASAVVHPGVVIGSGCQIMDNAVILPNTRIGNGVTVKPNATIGGDGFQIAVIRGERRVVPHAGGVEIDDGAFIGSSTCVDRGLFGESTFIGAGAMVDNLVHVAHAATIGADASVIACSEISGTATIGRGAWLGPNSSVSPSVVIGDYAYLGTASTVVRDIPAHALAYGSPAKPAAWVCRCHAKLPALDEGGQARCAACGTVVSVRDGVAKVLGG